MNKIKNKIEHNKGILREIQNRIMKEIWSIIPTSLVTCRCALFELLVMAPIM